MGGLIRSRNRYCMRMELLCVVTNFCGSFNVVIWDKIAKLNSLQIFNFHIVSCSAILNVHACITSIGLFYKGDVVH